MVLTDRNAIITDVCRFTTVYLCLNVWRDGIGRLTLNKVLSKKIS